MFSSFCLKRFDLLECFQCLVVPRLKLSSTQLLLISKIYNGDFVFFFGRRHRQKLFALTYSFVFVSLAGRSSRSRVKPHSKGAFELQKTVKKMSLKGSFFSFQLPKPGFLPPEGQAKRDKRKHLQCKS